MTIFYFQPSSERIHSGIWYIVQAHIKHSLAGRKCCIGGIDFLPALHTILQRINSKL
jgi:hypothetical protein